MLDTLYMCQRCVDDDKKGIIVCGTPHIPDGKQRSLYKWIRCEGTIFFLLLFLGGKLMRYMLLWTLLFQFDFDIYIFKLKCTFFVPSGEKNLYIFLSLRYIIYV